MSSAMSASTAGRRSLVVAELLLPRVVVGVACCCRQVLSKVSFKKVSRSFLDDDGASDAIVALVVVSNSDFHAVSIPCNHGDGAADFGGAGNFPENASAGDGETARSHTHSMET